MFWDSYHPTDEMLKQMDAFPIQAIALNMFFKRTRAMVVFGLNALNGRKGVLKGVLGGPSVSTNAYDFIQYTVDHGYRINAWELGNELSGSGVGTRISSKQYAADVIKLNGILTKIYEDF
ncbi:hypothetical protein SUGI_0063160 [Cryptomeria japonica]|nr:hypothetical protein SUGI_0063160 [Cryptomeria japonica]